MTTATLGFHQLTIHSAADLVSIFELLGFSGGDAQPFEGDDMNAFEFGPAEAGSIQRIYIVCRHDAYLIYLVELREQRGVPLRGIAYNLLQRGPCLIVFTQDYREVVFVDPRFAGTSTKSNLRLSKLKLVTAEPTRHDLDTLNAIHAHNRRTGAQIYDAQAEAFSVSALTSKFDREYAMFFRRVCDAARRYNVGIREFQDSDQTDKLRAFAQRLLGRLMFLYFLQRKGWLNGRQKFLTEQYRACMARHRDDDVPTDRETFHFYTEVMAPLFFVTMNTPIGERQLPDWARWDSMPYLNGGLFDPQRDPSGTIILPDSLFDPMNNDGILAFLNRYNFTISEDTPLEQDVAVDPEMLGKVFENQLEEQDRGQSGSFYTPRVIVAYMCQEALAGYIEESAAITRERVRALFDPDSGELLTADEAAAVNKALDTLTVLDPAAGSGSFLIGMMNEILWLRRHCARAAGQAVDSAQLVAWKEAIIRDTLYGVDIKPEAIEVAQLRLWLALVVEQRLDQAHPLPNLEYKLMAGNSLIETIDGEPILTPDTEALIDGAPNASAPVQLNFVGEPIQHMMALFDAEKAVGQERARLDDLRRAFFRAAPDKRADLRAQITEQERRIVYAALHARTERTMAIIEGFGKKAALMNGTLPAADQRKLKAASEKLTRLNALESQVRDLRQSLPFFLYRLYFHEVFTAKGGFDIVVANPPYVRQEMIRDQKPELEQSYPEVYTGTADLYVFFYARGLRLVRAGGRLVYISPNKFMRAGYGAKLRDHLQKNTTLETLIDFGDLPLFDATTYPMITVIKKAAPPSDHAVITLAITGIDAIERMMHSASRAVRLPQSALGKTEWQLSNPAVRALMDKLRAAGKPLGEYVQGKFYYGIKTGLNEAFVIDEAKRQALIDADPRSAEIIKPFLRGRDVKRWKVNSAGLHLITIQNSGDQDAHNPWANAQDETEARAIFQKSYSAIHNHLASFEQKLRIRQDQGRYWWELRACAYYQAFEVPKIIYQEIATFHAFAYSAQNHILNNKCFFIPSTDLYLLGLLNVSTTWWFLGNIVTKLQGNAYTMQTPQVAQLPIADAPQPLRDKIAALAQQCLDMAGDAAQLTPLEAQLNALVYEAYGLNDAEISLIEQSVSGVSPEAQDENE